MRRISMLLIFMLFSVGAFAGVALTDDMAYIDKNFSGVYSTFLNKSDGITMIVVKDNGFYTYMPKKDILIKWRVDSIDHNETLINLIGKEDSIVTMKNLLGDIKVSMDDGGGFILNRIRAFTKRDADAFLDVVARSNGSSSTIDGREKATEVGSLKASFDCKKASTKTEIMICSDPALAQKDIEMGVAFKQAVAASGDNGAGIKKGQKAWMKERNKCGDTPCLLQSYQEQIDELVSLRTYMSKPAEFR